VSEPTSQRPHAKGSGNVRFRVTLYLFWVGLGLLGAARLVEGGQSVLGFWGSVLQIIAGGMAALVLLYGAVTGRMP
jgi:hypothetical protein